MLEEQSRNYNQQFGTSKMYGPTKKFMFPRRQRGPGGPRGHQSRNTRGRGGRPCSMTKNEKAVLKLLTKITNELSMGKTVSLVWSL
ncbi:hypothetical protein Avbf_17680 [Armadillidium vulgare]|nr:hypothetical protein Avbf_17680 [Armadillidium vulgare]